MTGRESNAGDTGAERVLGRRLIGWALGAGGAGVILFELAALISSAVGGGPEGTEQGAVWTILLMILVTFLTLGGFGWGLYRAIRGDDAPPEPGAGDA